MPSAKEFAYEVNGLALTITGYQEGKSGQNGLCDCIGLVMGALGKTYPMHSTNYFARYQIQELRSIGYAPLAVGEIVYKARNDTSKLNARYQPGGRYYTGDMLDYYHVGVVTAIAPLEITHCTSDGSISGIKRDSGVKGWTHAGRVLGVDYAAITNAEEDASMVIRTAYVVSENGKPVRMRKAPGTDAETIVKLSTGTVVDVTEQAEGWAKIIDLDGRKGYMMTHFLKFLEYADENVPDQPDNEEQSVARAEFEQDVIERLTRIETLLSAISGGAG